MRGPRPHRLPQRLDYALIPAPLDLTLPLVDDKAKLPAIIVTPSSPSGETDFSIAFLAPPPKEGFLSRLAKRYKLPFALRPRIFLVIGLLFFFFACHLFAHGLATRRPRLHFDGHTQHGYGAEVDADAGGGWFDLGDYWGSVKHPRDFVIVESTL